MPAPPRPDPPADVCHVAISGNISTTTPWANIFWFRNGAGTTPTQGDLDLTIDGILAAYKAQFLPSLGTAVSLQRAIALYYGASGGILSSDRSTTGSGARAAAVLPSNCAICVSWAIPAHYRGGHPRTYLPGPTIDTLATPRTFSPSYPTEIAGKANAFITAVNAIVHGAISDVHLGTVSFVLRKAWRTPPVFRDFTPTGAHCDARVDSMRRRLGRDIP